MILFILFTSLPMMVTKGFTPQPGLAPTIIYDPTEDDSKEDEEDESVMYGMRLFWPIALTVFAALIFGVIYSCSKNKICTPGGASRNQQSSGGAASQTNNNDSMDFANSAFDTSIAGAFTDFPGSSFGEGIEMVPPPYCEKPPDYDDIFRDSSHDNTDMDHSRTDTSPGERRMSSCSVPLSDHAGESPSVLPSGSADHASGSVLQVSREGIDAAVLNVESSSEPHTSTGIITSVDL